MTSNKFPNCMMKGHMHIRIEKPDQVILTRCCTRDNEVLSKMTLSEFSKIDPYEWCLKNFKKNPIPHDFNCHWFEESCDYTKDLELKCVEVAMSHACNAKCPMCFVFGEHSDSKEMKDAYFKTLYSLKGKGLEGIRLTDRGEPFFYKNEVLDFLESCTSEDFQYIICSSNAQLLDYDYIRLLSELPFKIKVDVSLDSLIQSVYKEIRSIGALEKVKENILYLKEFGLLNSIHTVIQSDNIDEIVNIKNFSESLGVAWTYGVLDGFSLPEDLKKLLNYS